MQRRSILCLTLGVSVVLVTAVFAQESETASSPVLLLPVSGLREVQDWQFAGDLATALDQHLIAYEFYVKMEATFPGTRHGRYGKARAKRALAASLKPKRSPAEETPRSWKEEFVDWLTWP